MNQPALIWRPATDPVQVHSLLIASDNLQSTKERPAPTRNPETSVLHVRNGAVHGLFADDWLVGMVTLTDLPPFGVEASDFGEVRSAMYMQRLAVHPDWSASDPLVGLRCIKGALEIAARQKVDVVRAQANPGLTHVVALLRTLRFVQQGPAHRSPSGAPHVNLQREMTGLISQCESTVVTSRDTSFSQPTNSAVRVST